MCTISFDRINGYVQQLNVDKDEVEELLIGLILEGKVEGRIDQVNMRLELDRKYEIQYHSQRRSQADDLFHRQSLEKKRYAALQKWTDALESVHGAVASKLAKGGPDVGPMGMVTEFPVREMEARW